MPYHEFTTRGRLHRRSNAVCGHFSGALGIDPHSELAGLVRQLKQSLGAEGFYRWACSLPPGVVGPGRQYVEAVRERLEQLEAGRAPQLPTGVAAQLYLFWLNEEMSSLNSVAQESSGVTILEQENGRPG